MGQRHKAEQALAAFLGDRDDLGARVDATRAARDVPDQADDDPDIPAPMPPPGAHGSWVWVDLPDGAGRICARAIQWVRVTPCELAPTGWALRVYSPYWRALPDYVAGGVSPTAMEETQLAPSSAVTPIPGRYAGVPREE